MMIFNFKNHENCIILKDNIERDSKEAKFENVCKGSIQSCQTRDST